MSVEVSPSKVNNTASNDASNGTDTKPCNTDIKSDVNDAKTDTNPINNENNNENILDNKQETKDNICASLNCNNKASSLKCPFCIKLKLPESYFCSQICFKKNYKTHNKVHKYAKNKEIMMNGLKTYKIPEFNYTGELRPSYITPMRTVPNNILKPDYWKTGTPLSEERATKNRGKEIPIYSDKDIEGIKLACKLGREVLDIASSMIKVGITTEEIDYIVHEACIERECYPSPLNYRRFPKSCCTSVNEVICHGIPDSRQLKDGDILNIDITVYKNGYHGDLNETFCVGNVDPKYMQLIKVTHDSLMESIKAIKPNVMCRKFGEIIDKYVSNHGYSVTRTYCGHGIGKLFHCNPNIPHYKKNKAVGKLRPNMVFTIEPMINYGNWKDKTWSFDNWTAVTIDGKRSAQFEHTIVVTHDGCEVLTARKDDSTPLWWEDKTPEYIADIERKAKEAKINEAKIKENNAKSKDSKKSKKQAKKSGNKRGKGRNRRR